MCDVVVVGGGVIGLSTAFELAGQGLSVRVLDQGQPGHESSWAGAGMLIPGNSDWAITPEARLRAASHALWPAWAQQLQELTGIDTGYFTCGALEVRLDVLANDDSLASEIKHWQAEGLRVDELDDQALRARFPALASDLLRGYFLPDFAQVRNPWLIKALQAGCVQRGVELFAGHPVLGVEHNGHRVHTVRTPGGEFAAGQFVIATGAWSRALAKDVGCLADVEPVRGQIVLLEARPLPFTSVIQAGLRYLVPRKDGRILIGATEEHVGFDKRTTAAAIRGLLEFGERLVPALADAKFDRAWCGLRPYRPGGLPLIGMSPRYENVALAVGHFRAGLQLSPITAVLIRQLLLSQTTTLPLESIPPAS